MSRGVGRLAAVLGVAILVAAVVGTADAATVELAGVKRSRCPSIRWRTRRRTRRASSGPGGPTVGKVIRTATGSEARRDTHTVTSSFTGSTATREAPSTGTTTPTVTAPTPTPPNDGLSIGYGRTADTEVL